MKAAAEPAGRWRPRVLAGAVFGIAGTIVPASWFLPSVLSRRDGVGFVLFIGLPGLAAALAGMMAGAPLCDAARLTSRGSAVIRGAAVATLALVLFAPMFAIIFAMTAPGRVNAIGLAAAVLAISALAVGWVVAAIGGALGWLLHRLVTWQTTRSATREREAGGGAAP